MIPPDLHDRPMQARRREAEGIPLPLDDKGRHLDGVELVEPGGARAPGRGQWKCEAEHASGAGRRLGAAGDAGARRPSADDEERHEPAWLVGTQPFDDSGPGCIELPGRCGRAAPRHAVGLLDEDDAPIERRGCAMRRGEIGRADAAAGTVPEDEEPGLPATPVEMRTREAVGCLDLEDAIHHATADHRLGRVLGSADPHVRQPAEQPLRHRSAGSDRTTARRTRKISVRLADEAITATADDRAVRTLGVAVAVVIVAGCAHAVPHRGPIAPREWKAVFNDWYTDGVVDGRHPCAAIVIAIAHLPSSTVSYSTITRDLANAERRSCTGSAALRALKMRMSDADVAAAAGAPGRVLARCWLYAVKQDRPGRRVCFTHGRVTTLQWSLHG
jgi:hypothetical protein